MYYPYFIAYMAAGFVICIVVFFWALNNGQFKDQQRARFLPLADNPICEPLKVRHYARFESYALFAVVCIVLASSIAVISFSLWKAMR